MTGPKASKTCLSPPSQCGNYRHSPLARFYFYVDFGAIANPPVYGASSLLTELPHNSSPVFISILLLPCYELFWRDPVVSINTAQNYSVA